MNTEMTSTPPFVLLGLQKGNREFLKLPRLGDGNLFEKARIRIRKGFRMGLPRIQSQKELLVDILHKKTKESRTIKRVKMYKSHGIQPISDEEVKMQPIQSLNFIKRQLVHITAKSMSLEEKSVNASLRGVIKKRNKQLELSPFRIDFTHRQNNKHSNSSNNSHTSNKIIDLIRNFNINDRNSSQLENHMSSMELKPILLPKEYFKRVFLFKERDYQEKMSIYK